MEPVYSNGDILLVRRQPDIDISDIGIFIKGDQGYIIKKGTDRLISLNKAYPYIYPSECEEILCYGKFISRLEKYWIR